MSGDIKEMEIADYGIMQNIKATIYRLWKLKLVPVFATCIGILLSIAFLVYKGEELSFYSSATIYSAVYGSYSETVSGVTIMNTYSTLLGSTRVCNRAAAELNNSEITAETLASLVNAGNIYLSGASVQSKSYGYKLVLYTRMNTSENVVSITNAMANAFTSEINELLGTDVIQVFDEATYVRTVSSGSRSVIVLLFALAGFAISCAAICIKEFFSSKVYIVSQCEMDKNKILGIIPFNR